METRANYILIGAFTILGFLGMLAFSLWFARVELDKQFAYYDVKFTSVSGLARASDVRFAGLPVGQVVNVALSPDGDGTILVRLEVNAETPVRTDSVATIESQGVTGVSYVGISAGDPTKPFLKEASGNAFPVIPAGRSTLQTLTEDAPEIVNEVLGAVKDLRALLNADNVNRVDSILKNTERASEGFAQSLDDFSVVASAISGFAIEISNFNVMLQDVTSKAENVMETASDTLVSIKNLAEETQTTVATGTKTLEQATTTLDRVDEYVSQDLRQTTQQLSQGLTETRTEIAQIGADARALLAEYTKTGQVATARLEQLQGTISATDDVIAQLDATLITMDKAAVDFDELVVGDGAAFVAEARAAIAPIAEAAKTDLPAIIADIRTATASANKAVTDISGSLTSAAAKADGLIDDASNSLIAITDTFTRANDTLSAVNSALAAGERTLTVAEKTFDGANRVINDDISTITTDLRRTINNLDEAIAKVSADIPGVTADLKAASESARKAFEDVARVTAASDPPIRTFTTNALPQFTRLARETRDLIANLDALTKQIQRDPARFFLGGDTPVYKR